MSEPPGTDLITEPELPRPRGGELAPAGDGSTFGLLPRAMQLARVVAGTSFVKKGLRDNPPAICAAILTGYEVGLPPMAALAQIDVIDGQPAMRAVAMRALIQSKGHRIWYPESTSTRCTVAGQRRGEDEVTMVTWTKQDAETAKLAGKDVWRSYPRAMLVARATSELARMIFSDVIAGIPYATEELEDSLVGIRDVVDGAVARMAAVADQVEANLPPETPSTTTRQAPARRRRTTTESSGDALADQSTITLDAAPSGPSEVTAAEPAEERSSVGHAPDTASLGRRAAAPEPSPAPFPADTWAGLDVPGDEDEAAEIAAARGERRDNVGDEDIEPATSPSSPTATRDGSPEPAPGASLPPESSVAVPLDRAQEVAMWCRDAGLERDEVCLAVSGRRTSSARELTEAEAGQALEVARAVARGDAVASKSSSGELVVRRLGDVEIRDQVLALLQTGMEKRRDATTEIIGRAGYVRGDGPRGARVSSWAGALGREQLLKLGAELRKAAPA